MSGILRLGQGVRDLDGKGKVSGILRLGQGVRDPEVRARCQGY